MQAPEGTLISFATQPGNVAADGTGGNSPFTSALATTIRKPGLGLFEAFNNVGLTVKRATGGSQQPWVSSSPIAGSFYFAGRSAVAEPRINAPAVSTQSEFAALQARLKALEDKLKKESESRIAIATPPEQPVETNKPQTPSISLESLAQEFLDNYVYQSQSSPSEVLAYIERTFAPEVDYYGERLNHRKILEDQRRYLAKWPRRNYRVKPGTDHITCDKASSSCVVWGQFAFDVSNPKTSETSAGVATFEFRVKFTPKGPKIVFENGNVVSRKN
jgi:Caspase domain